MNLGLNKFLHLLIALPHILLVISEDSPAATSVTRHGITWTFDSDYQTGNYANGDPWVIGPVTITAISPIPVFGRNGTVINPNLGRDQGFDDRIGSYNKYSDALNKGRNLPTEVPADSAIVSSISNETNVSYGQITTYAVLTVVSATPPTNAFRPAYIGGNFNHPWTSSDIDYNVFSNQDRSKISPPPISSTATIFEKCWYEQDLTWTGRFMHTPYQAANGYGKNMAIKTGDAILQLNLNYTYTEKQALAINIIQYGIDIFGAIQSGGKWYDTGGHNPGRLAPLAIAAMCLNNTEMQLAITGEAENFSELRQTFFVTQADIGRAPYYSADNRTRLPYTVADLGKAEWGETHTDNPARDGANWDSYYRDICGSVMQAPAIALELMGARQIINHEAFFEYAKRHLYYREDRYKNPIYYNDYDDGHAYGDGLTSTATPFSSNETPAFHRSFYLIFESALTVSTPGSPTSLIVK